MNDSVYDELMRLSLKREITTDDRLRIEATLAAHPELRERWESDAAVGHALRMLPNTSVSSNFTALVMDAIELENRAVARKSPPPVSIWRRWLQFGPAVALGLAVLISFGVHQYKSEHQRRELAKTVRQVSLEFASMPTALPSPEIFDDFDAIEQLRQVSLVSDDELIKVLQP